MTTLFVFFIGAAVGSFLNVLIDRLPANETILGRSHCDFCKKKIPWYDLFPVVSYLYLGGKCRFCRKKLSLQYPLIETLTGLVFVLIFTLNINFLISNFEFQILNFIILWGLVSCMIVIFFSDLKYHLISDYVLAALFIFGALHNIIPFFTYPEPIKFIISAVRDSVISGLIVGLPIFLIYYLSKETAMGLGDVLLTAVIGYLLGWKSGFLAVYFAFVTGAIYGVYVMVSKHKKLKSRIAFGPFLVAGMALMLFFGDRVFQLIGKIYGI